MLTMLGMPAVLRHELSSHRYAIRGLSYHARRWELELDIFSKATNCQPLANIFRHRSVEACAIARMAGGACRFDAGEQAIGVAVVAKLDERLRIATRLPFMPELLAAARVEPRRVLLERQCNRLCIHPCHHEDLPRMRILHNAWNKALLVIDEIFYAHT